MIEILFITFLILGIAYFVGGRKAAKTVANVITLIILGFLFLIVLLLEDAENPGYAAAFVITMVLAPFILLIRDYFRNRKKSTAKFS